MSAGLTRALRNERVVLACLLLLAALPLLWPTVPPLVDYPGHLGRYRVQLGIDDSPFLHHFYRFEWMLIGNLGVDLLVMPLSALVGLELAGKLLVIAIPVLTVGGMLAVAREVHGELPATALFALPLAYGYPFQFGFVNASLSIGLALCAFALWLRLGRQGRWRLRAALFVPIACLVWITHVVGWGVLGLLCFAGELLSPARRGQGSRARLGGTVAACMALTLPLLFMLAWRSGNVSGQTADLFNWELKWRWLYSVLREQDELWDIAGAGVLALVVVAGWIRGPKAVEWRLGLAALLLAATFVLMPRIVFGSAYADMRLVPLLAAMAILAIRPFRRPWLRRAFLVAGMAFLLLRIGGTTYVFWRFDQSYDRQLEALDHVPMGARILVLVGQPCYPRWHSARLEHIGSMAIVRRDAFVNDQWALPGAQLLTVRYQDAAPYTHDPSQMVPVENCLTEPQSPLNRTMAEFPRKAFDYLWVVNMPWSMLPRASDLIPLYRNGNTILYRIARAGLR